MLNHLTVIFWTLAYVIIVLCGIQNRKSHLLLMPLIAGSLNFAWEINALLLSRGFYGHVLWTGLDVLIVVHNVRFLEKGKRKKYLLLIVVFILVLYGMFRIPNVDGQRISVFAIDLITPASMRSRSGWSAVSAGPCIAAAHGHETVKNESCGAV